MDIKELKEVLDIITSGGKQNEDLRLVYKGSTNAKGWGFINSVRNDDDELIFEDIIID